MIYTFMETHENHSWKQDDNWRSLLLLKENHKFSLLLVENCGSSLLLGMVVQTSSVVSDVKYDGWTFESTIFFCMSLFWLLNIYCILHSLDCENLSLYWVSDWWDRQMVRCFIVFEMFVLKLRTHEYIIQLSNFFGYCDFENIKKFFLLKCLFRSSLKTWLFGDRK